MFYLIRILFRYSYPQAISTYIYTLSSLYSSLLFNPHQYVSTRDFLLKWLLCMASLLLNLILTFHSSTLFTLQQHLLHRAIFLKHPVLFTSLGLIFASFPCKIATRSVHTLTRGRDPSWIRPGSRLYLSLAQGSFHPLSPLYMASTHQQILSS